MRPTARLAGVRPTVRGAGFLLAAAGGLVTAYASGWPALFVTALFLAAAVLAALVTVVIAPQAVVVERRLDPPVVEQGVPARVRLTVRGPASGALEWVERSPSDATVRGGTRGLLHGGGPQLIEYEVVGRRRGALALGPFAVLRSDPLGLVTTRRRIGGTDPLIVLPRLHDVAVPAVVTRTDPESTASTAFGPVGDQRDVVARPYRSGDAMRSVDWRATAHRGELMVRTEAAAASSSTALALESRAGAWADDGAFEWAVEYAASVAEVLRERRTAVRFATDRGSPVTLDADSTLVALAQVVRAAGRPAAPELAQRFAGQDVRVVHLVTGGGAVDELHRLPPLPHGATGLVTVVAAPRSVADVAVPVGWRLEVLDPTTPVGRPGG